MTMIERIYPLIAKYLIFYFILCKDSDSKENHMDEGEYQWRDNDGWV